MLDKSKAKTKKAAPEKATKKSNSSTTWVLLSTERRLFRLCGRELVSNRWYELTDWELLRLKGAIAKRDCSAVILPPGKHPHDIEVG